MLDSKIALSLLVVAIILVFIWIYYKNTATMTQLGSYLNYRPPRVNTAPLSYSEQLADMHLDNRTKQQHAIWANQHKLHNQQPMFIDDIEENLAMNVRKGVGINAFKLSAPRQDRNNMLFVTEADSTLLGNHFGGRRGVSVPL
jgi:hypothetical protein